jgi:DNA-binding HxlR family transcriptional regulator
VAKRSYRQLCGLAFALDVVGERWAMLIVRDLVPGPRRFTDLFQGLPGIATDVLAERLRSLEDAGAVEQRELRHPVPANVYALTERGHELARIGGQLAAWGLPLLPDRPGTRDEYRADPRWALQTMARSYRGGLAIGEYRFTIGDQELRVDVDATTATIAYGHGTSEPRLAIECTDAAFFSLARGKAPRRGVRIVHGTTDTLTAFFTALPLAFGRHAATQV